MAGEDRSAKLNEEHMIDIKQLIRRLDTLDQRVDNMDSMISAVAERIMNQLVTVNITCPRCGKDIEIALIGTQKPKR